MADPDSSEKTTDNYGTIHAQPPPPLFLYKELVDRITRNLSESPRALIVGGRGMGKTSVLKQFAMQLRAHKPILIDCRSSEDPASRILAIRPEPKKVTYLLIDDIDKKFDVKMEKALRALPEDFSLVRIIATSRQPPRFIETRLQLSRDWDDSESMRTFQVHFLNPWEDPGNKSIFLEYAKRVRQESKPVIQDEVVQDWNEQIQRITGGHPALLGEVAEMFRLLVSPERNQPHSSAPPLSEAKLALIQKPAPDKDPEGRWKKSLAVYIEEHLLDTGMLDIYPTLKELKATPTVLEGLRQVARNDDMLELNSDLYSHLLRSGLVYTVRKDGLPKLEVSGELIKRAILEDERAGVKPPIPAGRPSTPETPLALAVVANGARAGMLKCRAVDGSEHSIELDDWDWDLIQELAKEPSHPVSVETLKGRLNRGEAAVRSAIHRLLKTLKSSTAIDGVVENVHGEGYVLHAVTPPRFTFQPNPLPSSTEAG